MPKSIVYDNTKIAVARILGDGKRQRTRVFTELQSRYLFEDRFGRPGKGNDKGKVEGLVGYARRNFLVPIPVFESFEALNAYLLECCRRRMADCLRGHDGTIGERLERDLAALQTLLPAPYDACEKVATRVSSLSLVRYRLNDYSVPTTYGHRDVLVRGYVHEVVISCGAEVIARHPRSYERAIHRRPLLLVPPVHMIPGVTIERGQALRSVHRSVQRARQFRHLRSLRLKGSPAHVSALSSPVARPASGPVIRGPPGRSSRPFGPAFLPPFGRPASASWAPCPAREFSPHYCRLTAPPAHTRAWDTDP